MPPRSRHGNHLARLLLVASCVLAASDNALPDLILGVKLTTPSCRLQLFRLEQSKDRELLVAYPCGPRTEGLITGVAVLGDTVYWGDSTNSAVMQTNLSSPGVCTTVLAGLNEPQGVAISPDGTTLFYVDSGEHYGTGVTVIGALSLSPTADAVPPARVIVTNFNQTGIPRGLAAPEDSMLYLAADDAVARVALVGPHRGEPVVLAANPPDGEMVAEGVSLSPQGNLYFTRFYGGIYQVDGQRALKIANTTYGTFGIASTPSEIYVVVDTGTAEHSDILAYRTDGAGHRVVCHGCVDSTGIALMTRSTSSSIATRCNGYVDCEDTQNVCHTWTPYCDVPSHTCLPSVRRCVDSPEACEKIKIMQHGECVPFSCDALGFCVPP